MRNWIFLFAGLLAVGTEFQTLAPVDISGFGRDRPIQAVVTELSSSACRGSNYFRNGDSHHDDLSYDVHISANVVFKNLSARAVLLYRDFNPAMTERVAASPRDIALGKFVAGFDGDRMAVTSEPKKVSIDDFIVINAGESYKATIRAIVFASTDLKKPFHTPGKYWVQLGIDARPDEFYFDGGAAKDFRNKWRSHGRLLDFVLTEPFPIEIAFDPNAPPCEE